MSLFFLIIRVVEKTYLKSFRKIERSVFFKEQILACHLRQFAAKSEKMDSCKISLFDEAKLLQLAEKLLTQETQITAASYTGPKKAGRKALPAELLSMPHIYDLTPEEKLCACGSA